VYPESPAQALQAQSKINAVNVGVDGKRLGVGRDRQETLL